jgi:hypothetical protein
LNVALSYGVEDFSAKYAFGASGEGAHLLTNYGTGDGR